MTRPTLNTTLLSFAALGAVLLSGCGASASPASPDASSATQTEVAVEAPAEVRVSGPASPPSLPILRMIEADALGDTDIVFDRWESADQLTAAATGGHEFVAAPLTTGAALARGGADLTLLNVSAWAVMGLVTSDPAIQSVADLAGTQLHVAMRASAVDYTMQLVLEQHGLSDSVEIVYVDPMNGPEQFLSGQISSLVTVEPQVTMLQARNPEARSLIDFSAEWADITVSKLPLPTAGTFVNGSFAAEHADTTAAFQEAYVEAATWVSEHPEEAGALAERELGLPAPIVAAAIPKIAWDAQAATEARPAVEQYFTQLVTRWPESVGGTLPEASFYTR
ncbi:ABC-type nitrate/sulfonate/bicarbonate transport systems, periplasmic components [Leucobacter sp. 7(1)]|uniref:ABC transporter substrate-binding protein n=1 Tax=Leucobacter sp. 7(1) TaxID=1255613 RepID=UPI00097F074D|nr:MqnA/MqnD/SBP family protein [Leucobacter sp. 7(1)]SJN11942.1 ABC-type nitrate/sulfonate/bicarbonate transport systems, periplasmic components [Leucobacter sp. 7(1)]